MEHLAQRTEQNLLDGDSYDYGNLCLLKFLGFTARQLSDLGKTSDPKKIDQESIQKDQAKLDSRGYQLNAASVKLTAEIGNAWMPNPKKARGK